MTDVSTFLSGHKPRTRTVGLCPDTELLQEIVRLYTEAKQLDNEPEDGSLADTRLEDVNSRLEELRDQAEASQYQFTVRSVGRAIWSALEAAHQPDNDTRMEYLRHGARLQWDPETFPAAAVAACLTEAVNPDGMRATFDRPRIVDGEVQVDPNAAALVEQMWFADPEEGGFEFGECTKLWDAVNDLNTGTASVPKSVSVSGRTRPSKLRPVPQETTESPGPSSLDGNSLAG